MRELVPTFRTPVLDPGAVMLPGELRTGPVPGQGAFDQDGKQPASFPVPAARA